jgi:hypothetical protein
MILPTLNTPRHENNGACPRCCVIFDKYPGFHKDLRAWFEGFQSKHPEAHISCAGRGHDEQNTLFHRGASKATYPKSAHNCNCAIDVFCMQPSNGDIYDKVWFYQVLAPEIPARFTWYGRPNAPFFEMPHIEAGNWHSLLASKEMLPVENVL